MRIDRYEIIKPLGAGGMSEVFLGRMQAEAGVARLVAIKRLLPAWLANREMLEMFIDEARITATLHHSNIAQTLDLGRHGDSYFIVMEYVHGVSLLKIGRRLADQDDRAWPMTAYILARVCEGLEYAHTKRDGYGRPLHIVHRDVSPNNVLVSLHGEVKLIDFGIARAAQRLHETQAGKIKGSLGYMSPEQVSGESIDHRTDIFTTGTLLYELLARRNPFIGESDIDTLERLRTARVAPLSAHEGVPAALERICMRALERDREQRYQAAGEMQEDLERYCHDHHYGARQLGSWIEGQFPELGPGLERLRTESTAGDHDLDAELRKTLRDNQEWCSLTAADRSATEVTARWEPSLADEDPALSTTMVDSRPAIEERGSETTDVLSDPQRAQIYPRLLHGAFKPASSSDAGPATDLVGQESKEAATPRPARGHATLVLLVSAVAAVIAVIGVLVWLIWFKGAAPPGPVKEQTGREGLREPVRVLAVKRPTEPQGARVLEAISPDGGPADSATAEDLLATGRRRKQRRRKTRKTRPRKRPGKKRTLGDRVTEW